MALEQSWRRYIPVDNPTLRHPITDAPSLTDEDIRTVIRVLTYLTSNHRLGIALAPARRLAILQDLERFPALQVCFAAHAFDEEGRVAEGKPIRYFLGMVRGTSAGKHAELMHLRRKRGMFRLEES